MEHSYAIIDTNAASNLQLQLQLQEYNDFYHVGYGQYCRGWVEPYP